MKTSPPEKKCITLRFGASEPDLITAVTIRSNTMGIPTTALWDTGASVSAISKHLIPMLKIRPFQTGWSATSAGKTKTGLYKVTVILPNGIEFKNLMVTDANLDAVPYDMLIGMDIIGSGDFAISHDNESLIVSYQFPSSHSIDFANE